MSQKKNIEKQKKKAISIGVYDVNDINNNIKLMNKILRMRLWLYFYILNENLI
jgi:hypothetical protein